MSVSTKNNTTIELPDDLDFDLAPEYSPQEIKRLNMNRDTCVICGTKTKPGLNHNFCPKDCDLKPNKRIDLEPDFYEELGFDTGVWK